MAPGSNNGEDRSQVFVTAILQLSMARTIEQVGDIVRCVARKLTGADGATFILKENDRCYYANEDAIAPLWKGKRFPINSCISGWVMLNKTPVIIPDIYQDPRVPHEAYRPTFVKSLAMVPIRKDNPLGAIGNYWSSGNMADQQTLNVLQALADITAVSIESINIHNDLERRVDERTKQLKEANEQLEKTNNELQTITYALSHDLKAPLRNIKFSVERMLDDLGDDLKKSTKDYTDKIIAKVTTSQNLIDDLLTLFQASSKDLDMREVDMETLALQVSSEYKDALGDGGSINIDKLPATVGDKVLLKHVWTNLISNAVKYSSRKQVPKINIGYQQLENSVVYCIEDNGVGFDSATAKNLFKPFTRYHSSSDFEGAGIGLSIVERVVSLHDGKLWVKSDIGKGTTVFFELPGSSHNSVERDPG